ncbi:dsDNA nuclease domain-containing protein [Acinetobacter bereziniae]|uniref:dsDNA nuclease domain-containing protein n=1 Tax=Acinetobacter bereziniae TaxID=106648 RepID=UPI00300A00FA
MSRSGSHAGRGFRYQDAVGVLLAVKSWGGELVYKEIIPEGKDDYEVKSSDKEFSLIQVKSRRDHLGAFPISEIIKFIKALWGRSTIFSQPKEFILLLESPPVGLESLGDHFIDSYPDLYFSLNKDPLWRNFASRTKVLIVSNPVGAAIDTISQVMSCKPLEAQVYYSEILSKIGFLANENGIKNEGSFLGLAISDVECVIRNIEPILNLSGMEKALSEGYCYAVDFLNPLDNWNFYQGVDTRPGHISAGLVLERPELRSEIIQGLDYCGSSIIVGPSGSGKSALMWDTVYSTRHNIRWFEIKKAEVDEVNLFIRMAQVLRASSLAPIGFVIDDVGHKFFDLWNELIRQIECGNGVVLLGSIREEDVYLLTSRSRSIEVRPSVNKVFAERLWQRLKKQEQTKWMGWQEPWIRSNNLLLEYTHLLTTGDRLEVLLTDQVERRIRENRDNEFNILKILSLVGASGSKIDIKLLSKTLNIDINNLLRALRRLGDEHLIIDSVTGLIRGSHQLRSKVLFDVCHHSVPMMINSTISESIASVSSDGLEKLVSYIAVNFTDKLEVLLNAVTIRITDNYDPITAIATFSGLGQAHIEVTLHNWIPVAQALGVENTQITSAVLFAIAETDLASLPFPDRLLKAIKALKVSSSNDPRLQLLSKLSENTVNQYLLEMQPVHLRSFLGALVGVKTPDNFKSILKKRTPNLNQIPLSIVADLLGTVHIIDPEIAISWTSNRVTEELLDRVPKEIPWSSKVEIEDTLEGRLLKCELFNIVPSIQTNIHDEAVALSQNLFGLDPIASVVEVKAIAADGLLSGTLDVPLAHKRIPRENNIFPALPAWNKRWGEAAANMIGTENYSDYLYKAKELLEQLLPPLERLIDDTLRKKRPLQSFIDRYGAVYEKSLTLTPPKGGHPIHGNPEIYTTSLQNLIFNCSAEMVRRFLELPANYGTYIAWMSDLIKQIEKIRKEPWELIGGVPEVLIQRIETLIQSLLIIAAESGVQSVAPWEAWGGQAKKSSPKNALRLVRSIAEGSLRSRTDKNIKEIALSLSQSHILLELHTRPNWKFPLPWPALEFLMIIDLDLPSDWESWIYNFGDSVREIVGDHYQIWLVPRVEGIIISRLTVGGVSQLFPAAYEVDMWIDSLNLIRLNDLNCQLAQRFLDYLSEFDGIQAFNLGESGRPFIEKNVKDNLLQKVNEELINLESVIQVPSILKDLRKIYDEVLIGAFPLAKCLAEMIHGNITTEFCVLTDLSVSLLIEDLAVQLEQVILPLD